MFINKRLIELNKNTDRRRVRRNIRYCTYNLLMYTLISNNTSRYIAVDSVYEDQIYKKKLVGISLFRRKNMSTFEDSKPRLVETVQFSPLPNFR